jgi:uncharacterized protein DUF6159
MGRIGRSFQLVKQSYRILMQDKELMVLPLVSGLVGLGVIAVAAGIGFVTSIELHPGPVLYLPLFLVYVVMYSISYFFQAAVIAGATERMRGGDPTVSSALSAAARRAGPIVMWAVVSATVGIIIKMIQDRVALVGKIVAGILGGAWNLATFFIVPVLVLEDRSMEDSFKRSLNVFKQTWGETIAGGAGLGMAALCAWVSLVAATGLLAYAIGVAAVAFFFVGAVALMVFFSALQGIYVASLFRYATEGPNASGFDPDLLRGAFVPKQ